MQDTQKCIQTHERKKIDNLTEKSRCKSQSFLGIDVFYGHSVKFENLLITSAPAAAAVAGGRLCSGAPSAIATADVAHSSRLQPPQYHSHRSSVCAHSAHTARHLPTSVCALQHVHAHAQCISVAGMHTGVVSLASFCRRREGGCAPGSIPHSPHHQLTTVTLQEVRIHESQHLHISDTERETEWGTGSADDVSRQY